MNFSAGSILWTFLLTGLVYLVKWWRWSFRREAELRPQMQRVMLDVLHKRGKSTWAELIHDCYARPDFPEWGFTGQMRAMDRLVSVGVVRRQRFYDRDGKYLRSEYELRPGFDPSTWQFREVGV